jgi:surface antigen
VVLKPMFEYSDFNLLKRQFAISGIFVVICLVLVSMLASVVQSHRSMIASHIQATSTSQATQSSSDDPNVVSNVLFNLGGDFGRGLNVVEAKILRGTISISADVTHFDSGIERNFDKSADSTIKTFGFAFHIASDSAVLPLHIVNGDLNFVAHTQDNVYNYFSGANNIGSFAYDVVVFPLHIVNGDLNFVEHMQDDVSSIFSGVTNVGSLIQPSEDASIPVITQNQAQQAAIIQSGTQAVAVAAASEGSGGACDDGNGNGGYPMSWCNAAMDTIPTISYSNDPINRECTSYAYWYFTSVEGHTNFYATGNAKYWANTSNYPTSPIPVVGAIAVETVGTYGHVAIVQALPGQVYAGHVVPAGYVLVSEMNYDWQGHFRYSYSPLSKFSSYIEP